MTRRALTSAAIARLKPPAAGQVDHFDAGYPGLALRVSYGGSRSWVYFYRWQSKQRRLTLGPWPAVDLADARDAWREARKKLARGEEPTVTIAASVPKTLVDALSERAEREGWSRSEAVTRAIRGLLGKRSQKG